MDQATDHTPHVGRYHVLAAICLAALVLPLSFTGGAVATPAIGKAFDAEPSSLTWITNAFMLSFGSLLMAAGTLSDIYGRKRLFTLGLALFVIVSILRGPGPHARVQPAWHHVRAGPGVRADGQRPADRTVRLAFDLRQHCGPCCDLAAGGVVTDARKF